MNMGGDTPGRDGNATATACAQQPEQRLADHPPGTRATVLRVVGSDATARRLHELGFTPGTEVEVVRRAPLRDPAIYRIKGYEICLRSAQATTIRTAVVPR